MNTVAVNGQSSVTDVFRRLDKSLPGWRMRHSLKRLLGRLPNASVVSLVEGFTYLSRAKLQALESHARQIRRDGVAGAFVECGVGAGGSAAVIGTWAKRAGRPLFLFDTFDGLPPPSEGDPDFSEAAKWTGQCRGSIEEIRALLSELHCDLEATTFIQGLFQDTVPAWNGPIALLHLDGDWYESTSVCLGTLWDFVSPGGFVQLDDYGTWQGCRRAVDEFVERHGLMSDLNVVDQGVWLRKRIGISR